MNFFITHYYILYGDFYFYIFAPTETAQKKETQNISHIEENNELDSYMTHLK